MTDLHPNLLYFSHWNHPLFDTKPFNRWPNWKPFSSFPNPNTVYDQITAKVSETNLKVFFSPDYSTQKLNVTIQILNHLGFDLDNRYHDRLVFRYRIPTQQSQPTKQIINKLLSTSSTIDTHQFIQSMVSDLIDNSSDIALKKQLQCDRKKIITLKNNHYPDAGFFIDPIPCSCNKSDCHFKHWKCFTRHFSYALQWKHYFQKHIPDKPPLEIGRADLFFKENEILPGGKWIDLSDDGNEVSLNFYPPPPEIIPYSTENLSLSDEIITLDLLSTVPCRIPQMLNFYNKTLQKNTGKTWVVLTFGDLSTERQEMERYLFESQRKEALYLNIPFQNVIIDHIDHGGRHPGEITVEFTRIPPMPIDRI